MQPPSYFHQIRDRSAKRWRQLEADPELAGPWMQLFRQVQSPRHVLSELLQNADDAGATEAAVNVESGIFSFVHNGEDFTSEHFSSLCSFGYSNKRALHTIGFRGIGFKSTFSLGGRVEVYTPTLAVAFDHKRFTLPQWIDDVKGSECTEIRVSIADSHRSREIEKNLDEWAGSALSLLFFSNVRKLQIGTKALTWRSEGTGPVEGTEWMVQEGPDKRKLLVVRSDVADFPSDAVQEIREERLVAPEQETALPPCKVELVLGVEGRLYVVLPTGVTTKLPFACNAPFVQDPARVRIKDPETSPTNRWLLQRIGELAATTLLNWVSNTDLDMADRAQAYGLFTDVDRKSPSLEGVCGAIVEESLDAVLGDSPFILTDDGALEISERVIFLPGEITEVWPPKQATALFDEQSRQPLTAHIAANDRKKLLNWGVIASLEKPAILGTLNTKHLPKPKSWLQLMRLWAYLASDLTTWAGRVQWAGINIVPAAGTEVLYSAPEVVRLGDKRLLQSDADWQFLAGYLKVLNPNWPRYIAEQRRADDKLNQQYAETAASLLSVFDLSEASNVDEMLDKVSASFFTQKEVFIDGCVRLAQIAAKLGATPKEHFQFVTRDKYRRTTSAGILWDKDGTLESLLPKEQAVSHLVHESYSKAFTSCTQAEWAEWISSGQSGLLEFPLPQKKRLTLWGRDKLKNNLRERGLKGEPTYYYVTNNFYVEDYDFEGALWVYWTTLSAEDPEFWAKFVERLLAQRKDRFVSTTAAKAYQVATTGRAAQVTSESLFPAWIVTLRESPCLRDTRGAPHKPEELMRRTPETEAFLDVEPFVDARIDTEANRPFLRLLGVRDQPTGPKRVLERLRALSKAKNPPAQEVDKWYRRLDQMFDNCATPERQSIIDAFHTEKLIYTHSNVWLKASEVFRLADEEDAPGAELIRDSVRELSLWPKIRVAERPTAELAIGWLNTLPLDTQLGPDEWRRVRALLPRHAARIWSECGHWINLAAELVETQQLRYSVAMHTLVPWSHLHESIKKKTADFQRLTSDIVEAQPFSHLEPLGRHIEDRLQNTLQFASPMKKAWLNALGEGLRRIKLAGDLETTRIRSLANRLAQTVCQTVPVLEIVPYIDGVPAGTPRKADALWRATSLFLADRPAPKLALAIAQELGREFDRVEITDAIKFCFERPSEFVSEYLEEHFELIAPEEVPLQTFSKDTGAVNDVGRVGNVSDMNAGDNIDSGDFDLEEEDLHDAQREQDARGDENEATQKKTPPRVTPPKPTLIERFAKSLGYQKDGQDRYFHPDGTWIQKAQDDCFPWERRGRTGELITCYWLKEHCLELHPLEVEADIWGLVEEYPEKYSFVLVNPTGIPIDIQGGELKKMKDEGALKLYPATYRIVRSSER